MVVLNTNDSFYQSRSFTVDLENGETVKVDYEGTSEWSQPKLDVILVRFAFHGAVSNTGYKSYFTYPELSGNGLQISGLSSPEEAAKEIAQYLFKSEGGEAYYLEQLTKNQLSLF